MKKLALSLFLSILLVGLVSSLVTLNYPSSGFYAGERNVLFNSTSTSNAGLLNVSLWTNEGGTWSRKNSTAFGAGAQLEDILTGVTWAAGGTQTAKAGEKIQTNKNLYLLNVTKESGSGCTKAYLYDSGNPSAGSLLAQSNFVGDNASFNYFLEENTVYYVVCDNNGASYTMREDTSVSYPISKTNIDYIKSWFGVDRNQAQNIYSIHTGEVPINKTESWYRYISDNNILWNVESCNATNVCEFAASNNTLKIAFEEQARYFNSTSFETASETFTIDIWNATQVHLNYSGTQYLMTKSGDNYTRTIDIPEGFTNNSFNFIVSNGTTSVGTSYSTQEINRTIFTYCNSSYTNNFLKLLFTDETSLDSITGSIPSATFTYYLGSGTTNKTYDYINNTVNGSFEFCASPPSRDFNVIPYVQYKNGTTYPQRIWNPIVKTYTEAVTNKILYLLKAIDGQQVTFQVVNQGDQVISGVDVIVNRTISGSPVTVGSGITSDAGSVSFFLNPDFVHEFTFSKAGFETYQTSYVPTEDSYTIYLGGTDTTVNSSIRGIRTSVLPVEDYLLNNTQYTFAFNLTSSYFDVTEYGFNLRLANGTEIDGGSTGTEGTQLSLNYNTKNETIIYMDYYWLISGNYTNSSIYWIVHNTQYDSYSLKTFFTDLDSYIDSGIFGLDNFGRNLIVFIILFLTIGILSYKYGVSAPLGLSAIIFLVVFFFDVTTGLIPTMTLMGREVQNFPTFITGLILALLVLNEVRMR